MPRPRTWIHRARQRDLRPDSTPAGCSILVSPSFAHSTSQAAFAVADVAGFAGLARTLRELPMNPAPALRL